MIDYVLMTCFSYKVIGDKKGGVTSEILIDPSNMSKLEAISQIVQVPMKFIHVHRNPFDNIATMMLKKSSSRNAARDTGVMVNFCSCPLLIELLFPSSSFQSFFPFNYY